METKKDSKILEVEFEVYPVELNKLLKEEKSMKEEKEKNPFYIWSSEEGYLLEFKSMDKEFKCPLSKIDMLRLKELGVLKREFNEVIVLLKVVGFEESSKYPREILMLDEVSIRNLHYFHKTFFIGDDSGKKTFEHVKDGGVGYYRLEFYNEKQIKEFEVRISFWTFYELTLGGSAKVELDESDLLLQPISRKDTVELF